MPKDTTSKAKRYPLGVKMGLKRTLWAPQIIKMKPLACLLAATGLDLEPCGVT